MFQTKKPAGVSRAWMIAFALMIVAIMVGIHITKPAPKQQYSADDLKASPGAGQWAHKETFSTPQPTPEQWRPVASERQIPRQQVSVPPIVRRKVPTGCPACEARARFLAQAEGSSMEIKVTGANVLEVSHEPKPISTKQGRPMTVWGDTRIYAVLDTAINSDRPGDVTAHTSIPIRDSLTETQVLIPVGSVLHGMVTDNNAGVVNLNNNSVSVAWDTLTFPNGAITTLPKLPSADVDGMPGLSDEVDRHALQVWGPAILTSAIIAGAMLSTTSTYGGYQGYSPTSEALGQFGNSIGQKSISNLNQMLGAVRPTKVIRQGTVITVFVREPGLPFDAPYEG